MNQSIELDENIGKKYVDVVNEVFDKFHPNVSE